MKIYGKKKIVLPKKLEIPKLDDERLLDLYRMLKPIVVVDGSKFLCREYDIRELKRNTDSFYWNRRDDMSVTVDPEKLEMVEDFICLHSYIPGYECWFMPSVAEVLSQAPIKTVREANVFEIIEAPQTVRDMYKYKKAVQKHLHLSKVRSYKMY